MTPADADSGQVVIQTVLLLSVLLGLAALVIDVGSWFRADRRVQATADAAALAGAQALPDDPAEAISVALDYAGRNGGGVGPGNVSVQTDVIPNDLIVVEAHDTAPGFFSRLFSVFSVDVGARAEARAAPVGEARWVAPIAVDELHPLLQCRPLPCFGESTQLQLANLKQPGTADAAGAFGLVDLDRTSSGSPGAARLAEWLRRGFDGLLAPSSYANGEDYESAPGASFNSSQFRDALNARLGDELLFPVYRSVTGSGANAAFDVVGWVGFRLTGFSGSGSSGTLTGAFTRVTWEGTESTSPTTADFGVRTVLLVR